MPEVSNEIRNMRSMAWERAKGELRSILHTYWDEPDTFKAYSNALKKFIETVEDNGLTE